MKTAKQNGRKTVKRLQAKFVAEGYSEPDKFGEQTRSLDWDEESYEEICVINGRYYAHSVWSGGYRVGECKTLLYIE